MSTKKRQTTAELRERLRRLEQQKTKTKKKLSEAQKKDIAERKRKRYLSKYDEIKKFHKFTFARRPKKEFTPQQKAAITRAYDRINKPIIAKLERGRGSFKPIPKNKLNALKRGRIAEEGFIVTNRGIYIPGVDTTDKKKKHKVRITGKGKNVKVDISLPARREVFFPYDPREWESFAEFTKDLIKRYKPYQVMIQNDSGRGRWMYEPKLFYQYVTGDILPIIARAKRIYGQQEEPFVGAWLIFRK